MTIRTQLSAPSFASSRARQTRLPGATDNTRYGEGRASPHSFLTHHVANISTANPSRRRPNHLHKPSSTPPARARACAVSQKGSCKVSVF
jgi:hypothetical protein